MLKINASLLLAAAAVCGQTADSLAWKQFSLGPPTRSQSRFGQDGFQSDGVRLRLVVARAFGFPEHRIVGPTWIGTESYALTALVSNRADFQPLMQRELAARFYLMSHRETREIPVYVLKQLESGRPFANQPASAGGAARGDSKFQMAQATLTDFANSLADSIERPVFNETGIGGKFDITLNWPRDSPAALPAAVKQQLGLQLVEEKRPVELLMIDHIEKPMLSK